jgi:tripartite-type tricarboxylate transporter receptor subunit TctC
VSGWYGLVAPAATPRPVIARVHSVVQSITRQADVKEKLLAVGVDVVEITSAQFGQRITTELAKWEKIVKPLGITPD